MSDTTTTPAQASAIATRRKGWIRTRALWAAGVVLLLGTVVLMFERGGSQQDDVLRADAFAFATLGVLALVAPRPLVRGRWAVAALSALAGLAVWTAASTAWARVEIHAIDDAQRVALYVVAFAAALIAMRAPEVRRAAPWALLLGIAAASVYGLGTRMLPDVFQAEVFGNAGARLAHPITYWNGLGLVTGCGALLGIACAAEPAAPGRLRALACALAVPCGFACYMSLSRGAFVAVVGGLVVLAALRPRAATALAALCALAPVGVLAGALQALDQVRAAPAVPHAVQTGQGTIGALLVVAGAAAAGLAFAALAPRADAIRGLRPPLRMAAIVAIGGVAVILAGTVAISYASEQTVDVTTSASRLAGTKTFRGPYWDVALRSFAHHPLIGVGSGSFQVEWRRETKSGRAAFDAHSLYFETLAELGIVGGLLVAAFIAACVAGIAAAVRAAPRDPVLPAAAAVLAAFVVHAGVDWDWELPGVTLPVLMLAAAALAGPGVAERAEPKPSV
jgi:O-antigen ligase